MGVTNYDRLIQNHVTSTILDAAQVRREQKGSTQITTGENLRFHTTEYQGTFDWSGRLDGGKANFDILIRVKHAETPITDLAGECWVSSDGQTWSKSQSYEDSTHMYIGPTNMTEMEPRLARWNLRVVGPSNGWAAISLQAISSDAIQALEVTKV